MPDRQTKVVRRRMVFYIPGYDPIHPRRYRELYRKEGRDQSHVSGYELSLSPKATKGGPYGWHVDAKIQNQKVSSDFEVLVWSDIVRDSMQLGIVATYCQLLRTAWTYIGSGTLWRLMKLRKGPVIAALYPVIFLLLQLGIALFGAWIMAQCVGLLFSGWAQLSGFIVVPFILNWFRKHDGKFFAYYLMHDYSYSASSNGQNPPELEVRISEFVSRISDAMNSDCDEVLVVGHSSGAHLAVSILSDLIKDKNVGETAPKLGFLSLGQVVPMVSFLPGAHRLRKDLLCLSTCSDLTWVDVTAPGDGCAFALCDPVSVSGVAPPSGKIWPLVVSAAFTQTLSEARWAELRWRFFRLHFQYMCAFDRPGDYDYFQITAGPLTLADRYAGRRASGSRIETPVNKYKSVQE